jgi:hypothetical protein
MRTPEEDVECRSKEKEFENLQHKVCAEVEAAAQMGLSHVILDVNDISQILHVLSIRPFRVKTMEESFADLKSNKCAVTE